MGRLQKVKDKLFFWRKDRKSVTREEIKRLKKSIRGEE